MKRNILILTVLAIISLMFSGCGKAASSSGGSSGSSSSGTRSTFPSATISLPASLR